MLLLSSTLRVRSREVRGKDRSVMPLDVLGCTRAYLMRSTSLRPPTDTFDLHLHLVTSTTRADASASHACLGASRRSQQRSEWLVSSSGFRPAAINQPPRLRCSARLDLEKHLHRSFTSLSNKTPFQCDSGVALLFVSLLSWCLGA